MELTDEKLVNIPVSSEYTSNYETFKITETGLTELYNGTNWTEVNDLNTGRNGPGSLGLALQL